MKSYIKMICLFLLVAGCATALSAATKKVESSSDTTYSWIGYPENAKKSDAKLLIERRAPKTVRPNKDYTFEIKLTNKSYYQLDEVIYTEKLPSGFKVSRISPKAETRDNILKWNFGMLAPGQKEVITITGKTATPGQLVHEGSADVNFNLGEMTTIMEVVKPQFLFDIEYPKNVIVSEVIPVKLTFKNTGSAPVLKAKLTHTLTPGLVTINGNRAFKLDIGDLAPDDEKVFKLELQAEKVGVFKNSLVAKALNGVIAKAEMKNIAQKPKLLLTAKAPKKRFVGNNVKYYINLKNTGDGAAKNAFASINIPRNMKLVSANEGGKTVGGKVVWDIQTLQPGETKELEAKLVSNVIMKATVTAEAKAFAADTVRSTMNTEVAGIPAILIVLKDVNDPVPVGDTETYIVTVSNQGSLAATNVKLKCILEDSMEYVSSTGPTEKASLKGKDLLFGSLTKLEPKAKAEWKIIIKAKKSGDVRFNVEITSDQLTRPVKENESTNYYDD